MTSEIRANTLKNRVGLGTIEYSNTGPVISGVTTASNFKTGSSNLHSTGLTVGDTFVHSTGVNATSLDISGDIDVDGHTNLDNVSIAGVTTTVGDVTIGSGGENTALGVRVNSAYAQIKLPDGQTGANRKGNLSFGDNDDFRIVHDGHHNYITAGGGDIFVSTSSANPVNIRNSRVDLNVDLTLTDSATDSAAGPELKLFRNSASPANADYLGQIKFAGESSTGVERNYAKITGKILDVTNGSEDGILEFAHIKAGSQTITGRWRSDSLQLLNGTNFSVAGTAEITGLLTANGSLDVTGNIDSTVAGGNNQLKIETTSSGDPSIYFAASGSGGHNIEYIRSSNTLNFKQAGGQVRLSITAAGHLLPGTDSQYNIGSNTVRFANIYADTLYGDGSNLTGITQTTINGNADNRVITGSGTANTLNAESTFVHDPVNCDTQIIHNSNNVADLLVQNNSSGTGANARLTLQSGSNSNAGPQLGMICGSHTWYFQVPKAAGNLEITNNGTLDFLMADDGDFHIADGDLVISTGGHGIDFSADGSGTLKSLPNSFNAELLHDYEVGTFTPNIQYDTGTNQYYGSPGSGHYVASSKGEYIRIGDMVWAAGEITLTGNRNSTQTVHISIGGMPYNGMHSSQQNSLMSGWGGAAWPKNDSNSSYRLYYSYHSYTTLNFAFKQTAGNNGIDGFRFHVYYRCAP